MTMQDDKAIELHEKLDKLNALDLQKLEAEVRRINAESALLEGQAAHQQAQARNLDAQTKMQLFNVEVMAPIQKAMQQNTLNLQTEQIPLEIAKARAAARAVNTQN